MEEEYYSLTKGAESFLIKYLSVSAYTIPTDGPESDGTIEWDSTTMILVEIEAGGKMGIGYSYADISSAYFIEKRLKALVIGKNAMDIPYILKSLTDSTRNNGNCGIISMAISAVDNALWDLKAKLLGLSLTLLLGKVRDDFPIYGSGGFTSYSIEMLQKQLSGWAEKGIKQVKMKIGREPDKDFYRVKKAREAVGTKVELFVDANGAYSTKQALKMAQQFADLGVTWFEEPRPSDDLHGLHLIREHSSSATMNIAAGEYGYNLPYFEQMLAAQCVDVLQADATRCGGISTFLKVGHTCEAHQLPFSSHCAPTLHLQAGLSLPSFFIAEYFYDHVRIENMLFDGVPQPLDGALYPDLSRPGLGFEFKYADAEKYKV
ncbi:enolase C-terminal domain-like protein [Arachidicoccus sp.]|jgi:L-alanine-DL-glutamate epimerase-like enolase superfamily enzyme|uniref:enolase C-terminal domain-like protein n=1 Tax=Arachidicoccus sp. TaxID=1872624 RepID=UPI003D1B911A